MLLILIAIVLLVVASFMLMNAHNGLAELLGVVTLPFVLVALVVYMFAGFFWMAAEHKAELINKTYGTEYTQEQVFWAEDIIEEVRQVQRQRIELNGDLVRGK